jgi:hypothetical protein
MNLLFSQTLSPCFPIISMAKNPEMIMKAGILNVWVNWNTQVKMKEVSTEKTIQSMLAE